MTDSRSAHILAASSFILLLGIFSYWNIFAWFPTVVLSSGISLILGLIVKKYFVDVSVTLILFACLFFFSFTDFFSRIFLPAFLYTNSLKKRLMAIAKDSGSSDFNSLNITNIK